MTPRGRLAFTPANSARLVESGLDVVVTGGGGWLGQATLEMLDSSLGSQVAARVHAFGSSRRLITLRSGNEVEVAPLDELSHLKVGPHLLAHYAFATREMVAQLELADYVARNEAITDVVAGYTERSRPHGLLVLSSGAVYLGGDPATNPYGVLKQRVERRFCGLVAALAETGPTPRLVIPRLFNLSGPFLNKPGYVLGSIIRDIAKGGPVRLHARQPVVRSYIHVEDFVNLAFAMMLGQGSLPVEPFDTAGEREIEVGELAQLAATVLGQPGMTILRPTLDGGPPDRYVGDPLVFNSLVRSYGIERQGLSRQIEDTARYLET